MTRPQLTWVVLAAALVYGTDAVAQHANFHTLVARAGWARLEVLDGRLTAVPNVNHRNRSTTLNDPETGVSEMLSVVATEGRVTLHFQRSDARQQLTVDFVRGDTVSIHREPRGDSDVVPLHFTQGEGELSLVVGEGEERQFASASDLWRLLLFERALCKTHLVPVLESLRGDWALLDTADRVRMASVRAVEFDLPGRRRRCLELVAQLSSETFRERRAAYQELQTMGHAALACLSELDRHNLDAEQRRRLATLTGGSQPRRGDTPDMIAAHMIDDLAIWMLLLQDDQPRVRRVAVEQIERIQGVEIEFDVEGDAARRSEQLVKLRERFRR
ncbi:MAG: hypothetical protein RIC55_29480 [Pirellulaceae bacterium]